MNSETSLGFLLDVDNTLLDNDALKEFLTARLQEILGPERTPLFWHLYEEVRRIGDVVDLPATVEAYAERTSDRESATRIHTLLDDIPFRQFVYEGTIDTLHYLRTLGTVAILSDGDQVFQRHKIEQSGLAAAVDGHVLIFTHKEQHLAEVTAFQHVDHMVLVDDKARILYSIKQALGNRMTTVHILQGHYALEPMPAGFSADITASTIGDVRHIDRPRFLGAS